MCSTGLSTGRVWGPAPPGGLQAAAARPRGHRAVAPGAAKSEGVDEAKLDNALLHYVLCTRSHRCSNPR